MANGKKAQSDHTKRQRLSQIIPNGKGLDHTKWQRLSQIWQRLRQIIPWSAPPPQMRNVLRDSLTANDVLRGVMVWMFAHEVRCELRAVELQCQQKQHTRLSTICMCT